MLNTDPTHTHTYDTHGKMTCCSLEEKIYAHAEAQLKTEAHQDGDGHDHDHDHHDHELRRLGDGNIYP